MKKITALLTAVMMLLPAAANARELSAEEKNEKYGEYIMLDMSQTQFASLEYNPEYKQVDYIDRSSILGRDIERGKVMQIYTKKNWDVPVTAKWDDSWKDLSKYKYISFFINCRATTEMMSKIEITVLSADGNNDIVLPEIDCTNRMMERWYEISFPIEPQSGVEYTGLKINFYKSWLHIDDIAFSTKDPFANEGKAYITESFEGENGGDLTTFATTQGFSAAVKEYDGSSDKRTNKVQKLFTQNAGEATFTRSFKNPLDMTDYRYISLWAQTGAEQNMSLFIKDGQNILCEIPLNMTADNKWRKYSYYIGAMTKSADAIVLKNKNGTSQKAIYFDDITFSAFDPLAKGNSFCMPLEISGGAENGAVAAGEYTVNTSIVNNTSSAINNAVCIAAVYDSNNKLINISSADKLESFYANNAASNDGKIEKQINVTEDNSKIRMFIWNENSIVPIANSAE